MALTPFVYWAQTEDQVTLKVDLTDVKDLNVNLKDTTLQVTAYGQGARGLNNYSFDLNLHSPIDPNESNYKIIDREVDFVLKKKSNGWWPRLTSQPQKPSWLKIDFDKWKSEDMDDNEDEKRDILSDYPDMYDKLHKEELGYRKEDFIKVYLVIYNLGQFIGFIYVFAVMAIRYSRDGPDSMKDTYDVINIQVKVVQLLQFLEVLHPLLGYTNSNVLMCFLQTCGRGFVLLIIAAEPHMQIKPVVFYLFIAWSMVEIVRYPYYITQLLNIEISFITWLRYTIWIPLYPLGFISEGVVMMRSIPYFEETQKLTISLPNSYNFALHFPSVIRFYLLFLFFPGIYMLLSRMNQQRSKKLKMSKIKKKHLT